MFTSWFLCLRVNCTRITLASSWTNKCTTLTIMSLNRSVHEDSYGVPETHRITRISESGLRPSTENKVNPVIYHQTPGLLGSQVIQPTCSPLKMYFLYCKWDDIAVLTSLLFSKGHFLASVCRMHGYPFNSWFLHVDRPWTRQDTP